MSVNGGIRWHRRWVNVSHVLAEEHVGLEEVADGIWSVCAGPSCSAASMSDITGSTGRL